MFTQGLLLLGAALSAVSSSLQPRQNSSLTSCPGYTASNVQDNGSSVTADLTLAGTACNIYGDDIINLKLLVEYQTGMVCRIYLIQTVTDSQKNKGYMSKFMIEPSRSSSCKNQYGPDLKMMESIQRIPSLSSLGPITLFLL